MNEQYVNMRIKLPLNLHAQLLIKQAELAQDAVKTLSLADTAVTMIAEAFLMEHQYKIEKEEIVEENGQIVKRMS